MHLRQPDKAAISNNRSQAVNHKRDSLSRLSLYPLSNIRIVSAVSIGSHAGFRRSQGTGYLSVFFVDKNDRDIPNLGHLSCVGRSVIRFFDFDNHHPCGACEFQAEYNLTA